MCDVKRAIANGSVDTSRSFLSAGEVPACAGKGGMWYCYSFYEENFAFNLLAWAAGTGR